MFDMKKSKIVLGAIVMFAITSLGCSKSDECEMLSVADGNMQWVADGSKNFEGEYEKDDKRLENLNLTIKVSPKATYSPKGPYNFAKDSNITITVTSESGETQKFTLKVKNK